MLISKFNKMIRNKIVWGVFAFLVCISFILSFSALSSSSWESGGRDEGVAGTLFNRPVPAEEYYRAALDSTGLGQYSAATEEQQRLIRRFAWERMASLQVADRIGIVISPEEVKSSIGTDPSFQYEGEFNTDYYKAVVQRALRTSPKRFEYFVHQNLKISKLHNLVAQAAWISPSDQEERLRYFTDHFGIDYAVLNKSDLVSIEEVSDQEIQAVFEEHAELFRVGDQVRVKYISWPITNIDASLEFSEDEITNFYQANIEMASILETNIFEEAEPASDTNSPTMITHTNYEDRVRSMEEIRKSIVYRLQLAKAFEEVERNADTFLDYLLPPEGRPLTFDEAAREMDLTIGETDYFQRFDLQEDLGVGLLFNRAAFKLIPEPQGSFSMPVEGDSDLYILYYSDEHESHIPELDQIRDEVAELALKQVREEQFNERTMEIHERLRASIKEGASFTEALDAAELSSVVTGIFFSVANIAIQGQEPPEYLDSLLPDLLQWESNELPPPFPTPDGALIVYVGSRTAALGGTQFYRDQIIQEFSRERGQFLISDWRDYVLQLAEATPARGFDFADPKPKDEEDADTVTP